MLRPDLSVGALASAAAIAAATFAAALAGIGLTYESCGIVLFWPANGILAGALLRLPTDRHLPVLALGLGALALAHVSDGGPPWLAACDILEVLLVNYLARRLADAPPSSPICAGCPSCSRSASPHRRRAPPPPPACSPARTGSRPPLVGGTGGQATRSA